MVAAHQSAQRAGLAGAEPRQQLGIVHGRLL
jgi:hypothetical protein